VRKVRIFWGDWCLTTSQPSPQRKLRNKENSETVESYYLARVTLGPPNLNYAHMRTGIIIHRPSVQPPYTHSIGSVRSRQVANTQQPSGWASNASADKVSLL
jgi:hypothetical protein